MKNNHIQLRGFFKAEKEDDYGFDNKMYYKFDFIGFPLDKKHECRADDGNEFGCDDLIWMLYTGIKDKRGKKVFEGDILDFDEKEWGSKFKSVVTWNNVEAAWDWGGGTTGDVSQFRKVIGNIHENPELLEG